MKNKKHESYKELIWTLAVTDFKLRYQGSILGYVWALLQPLMMFLILNIVFSSVFASDGQIKYYSLQLITSLMLFIFFSEGTTAGLNSLVSKSQLVTKIYVPRWTIIVASTLNATLIFLMNLIVIIGFFIYYKLMPDIASILMFIVFIFALYVIILAFSLIAAPLYVKYRDLSIIWTVALQALMYLSPIIYPLNIMDEKWHPLILANPLAFIIHFNKEALINGHYANVGQYVTFFVIVSMAMGFGIWSYNKNSKKIAELI